MKKLILSLFCILCMLRPVVACNGAVIDVISPQDRWFGDVTVILDKEFSPGGEFEGLAEKVIDKINQELYDIQLHIKYSDEDLGLYADIIPLYNNGMSLSDALAVHDQKLRQADVDNPNSIIVTIDEGNDGFTGGGPNPICPDINYNISNCPVTLQYVGRVTLGLAKFRKLLTHAIAFKFELYGETYEAEDILMHEILHALGIKHTYGPYMVEQVFYDDVAVANISAAYAVIQPIMSPARTSNAYGLTEADKNLIYILYGEPTGKRSSIIFELCNGSDFGIVQGLNIALWPVIPEQRKPLALNMKRNKAVAKSTKLGRVQMYVKPGYYRAKVRNVAPKGHPQSGVEGELGNPEFVGEKWVCKTKGNKFTLCDDQSQALKLNLKQDRTILIKVQGDSL